MDLKHAECCRFREHARPGLGVKLAFTRIKRQRVGAIWTAERATVRQFGKKPNGAVQRRRRRSVGRAGILAFASVSRHQSEFQQAPVGKLPQ